MSKLGKKLLALLLAGTMTFSLAACGNKDAGTTTATTDNNAAATTEGSSAAAGTDEAAASNIDTSKHEVINLLVLGNKPSNGRLEAMLEKLNVILNDHDLCGMGGLADPVQCTAPER